MEIVWRIFAILFFIELTSLAPLLGETLTWLPSRESKMTLSFSSDMESLVNKKKAVKSVVSGNLEWMLSCTNGQKSSAPPLDFALTLVDLSYSFVDPLFSEQYEKLPAGFRTLQRIKGERLLLRYHGASKGFSWTSLPPFLEEREKEELLAFIETPLTFALMAAGVELSKGSFYEFEIHPIRISQGAPNLYPLYSMKIDKISETEIEATISKEIPQQKLSFESYTETLQEKGEGHIHWSLQNPLLFGIEFSSVAKRELVEGDDAYTTLFKTTLSVKALPLHQ